MIGSESALVFDSAGVALVGIRHDGAADARHGVVVVVGGPQYRVGSHREFVTLSRYLARNGTPVFRFDMRGMGDSAGEAPGFTGSLTDIQAAVDRFCRDLPSLEGVTLLGLCDGATQCLAYAESDDRIKGLILLNPWVRPEGARVRHPLRHYYWPRLRQGAFWRRVLAGGVKPGSVLRMAWSVVRESLPRASRAGGDLAVRMDFGLENFHGPILLLISNNDLVGREFLEHAQSSRVWQERLDASQVSLRVFADANHTMTARKDLDEAAAECASWLSMFRP